LNPLSSRLLPFRYFGDARVEGYYRRTLYDARLANRWSHHYLAGLRLAPGALVLDYGCGRGRHAALLSRLGFTVCAQDVATHTWWARLPDVHFQRVPAAAPKLPWGSNAFSLMLNVEVLHYLDDAEVESLVGEAFRVLAPGGSWIAVEANDRSYGAFLPKRFYTRLHSLARIRDVAVRAGFEEIDICFEGFYAPLMPRLVNFIRKQAWPAPYDVSDFGTWLESKTPNEKRALWRLRLRKPT
jgi:SAM-dependent methyltransferase